MRRIYITVALLFFGSILLFIGSFIYLDKTGHKIYYYIINQDGRDIGTVKVDQYETEYKIIYKSDATMPFCEGFTATKTRMELNRKYAIENYLREKSVANIEEINYLENDSGLLSSVTIFGSRFFWTDKMLINKYTFVFEDDSPVTYIPIIENYNFERGRSQGFSAVTSFYPELPPRKRVVTLTSIKNEFINIDSRKIKAENLILKIRDYPQGSIWVSKSDRSILSIEIPQKGLKITRIFTPKKIEANEYLPKSDQYISKDATFKTGNIQFAGTLTIPNKEGQFPAVLLVGGLGPYNRDAAGLFASIADYLSQNGFCVMRFDRRGTGSSGGDDAAITDSERVADASAAFDYLTAQKEVDPERIIVIGFEQGAVYALRLASQKEAVKGLILMAPRAYSELQAISNTSIAGKIASSQKWNDEYAKLVAKSIDSTFEKTKNSTRDWTHILGKKCFLNAVREDTVEEPLDNAKNIKTPVLILQGKEGDLATVESASLLDKSMADSGNPNHTLTYYDYIGHFFGKKNNGGLYRIHYEADKAVLENIVTWMNKNIPKKTADVQ